MKKGFFWFRISRPKRVGILIVALMVLLGVLYGSLGSPLLTLEQHFRRAEKANLVGPSTIVDTLRSSDSDYREFETLLVGETDHGILFFGPYEVQIAGRNMNDTETRYHFRYIEKTGDMTLVAAPNTGGPHWRILPNQVHCPVYLFTDHKNAVRAEVSIHVQRFNNTDDNTNKLPSHIEIFDVAAERSENGFFRFWLHAETETALNALYALSTYGGGNSLHFTVTEKHCILALVKLYDQNGSMVAEKQLLLYDTRE